MNIIIGSFVTRQTKESEFGYFDGDIQEVVKLTKAGSWREGDRDGVKLVQVSPNGFYTSVVPKKNAEYKGKECKKRQEHEAPVWKDVWIGKKIPAKRVDIVLYHVSALKEDPHYVPVMEGDYFEVVSINCSPINDEIPMSPMTMARNQACLPGGTFREYSGLQYSKSIVFWNDFCMVREA